MDMKDIFESGSFSPGWIEEAKAPVVPVRKELSVLLEELDEIAENIEKLREKQWYLARLMEYNKEGFSRT